MKLFGIKPKVAMLSHSNFGSHQTASAHKMRQVVDRLKTKFPDLELEGEMHPDAAISETIRNGLLTENNLKGSANLMVFPNLDAANICYNMTKMLAADGVATGPILMGSEHVVHILTPAASINSIINMTAFSAAQVTLKRAR